MPDLRASDGQSSVELVALLPLFAALLIGAWQAVIVGQSWWLAGVAARAATRAQLVGADPQRAARSALPRGARARVRVARRAGGVLEVRLAIPAVIGAATLGGVTATVGRR